MQNTTLSHWDEYEWVFPTSMLANRMPITRRVFITNFGSVLLLYYTSAVLVCLPNTRKWRLSLLPVVIPLAFATANRYIATGEDASRIDIDQGFRNALFVMAMRMTEWSLVEQPFTRTDPSQTNVFRNGLDLMFSLRGIGWSWGKSIPLPDHPSGKKTCTAFILQTLVTAVVTHCIYDTIFYTIQSFGPDTIATHAGGTIFDHTLPPIQRYARSLLITILQGTGMVIAMDEVYYIATLIAFCIPGPHRDPALWPPLHGNLWRITSLQQLWGKEWHQLFARSFRMLGARPLGMVFGRVGAVMGGFALSEVFHAFANWGFGRGLAIPGFFLMMGVGVVLEGVFQSFTGRKVGGRLGQAWMLAWVVWWAQWYVDDLLTKGVAGIEYASDDQRPAKIVHKWFVATLG